MLRHFVAICVLLLAVTLPAYATTVTFVVPPAQVGPIFNGGSVDLTSSSLNGISLSGQILSLDLVFANDILARLTMGNPGILDIGLMFSTNAGMDPGFAGVTTGSLRDSSGTQFGPSQIAGRASSSDGSFNVVLTDFTGPPTTVDLSGLHFDTSFPNSPGHTITNTTLQFTLISENNLRFGTPQQLPEPSSFVLLASGFAGLLGLALRRPYKLHK